VYSTIRIPSFIALMMEAARTRTSETSVDNYFTQQYNPEDKSELHTHRRQNLKSHKLIHVHGEIRSISNSRNSCHHSAHDLVSCYL
jgi:hypothetical protein